MSLRYRIVLVAFILGLSLAVLAGLPPIQQDPAYHNFADKRSLWIFSNASNVLSNAVFILAGVAGLLHRRSSEHLFLWRFFLGSIILVGIGSAYYHLAPGNLSLVLDRIPMSFGFASLISIVLAERFNGRAGRLLLFPLLLAGTGSVVYWYVTEINGQGDLRPYIAVQFFPMLLIPLLIALFPEQKSRIDRPLLVLLFGYCIAKIFEVEDRQIYLLTHQFISGHSLKHITAGIAILYFSLSVGQPDETSMPVKGA